MCSPRFTDPVAKIVQEPVCWPRSREEIAEFDSVAASKDPLDIRRIGDVLGTTMAM